MHQHQEHISRKVEGQGAIPGMRFEVRSATLPEIMEFSGQNSEHQITLVLKSLPDLRQCEFPTIARQPYLFGRVNFVPASLPYRIVTAGGSHRWFTVNIEPEFVNMLTDQSDDWDLEAS